MTERKRVVLVTGGRRGIGLGIARCLARDGLNISICDLPEEKEVQDELAGLHDLGAETLYVQADISDAGAREKIVDAIRDRFDRLDVLVNNAGVAPKDRADILEATEESFEQLMKINLQGPYFLTQLIAGWMIEQKKAESDYRGCIVNISSVSATVASTSRGDYCISKAGISMATKLWAARLAEFDIPVYEIRPGIIMTDMTAPVKEKYDKLIAEGLIPQARWGQPEDIGKAVAMMARGDIAYSTGDVIMVDGGMSIQRL
jgi:3-oxoacyl-[acyl-carrier protein] reductase